MRYCLFLILTVFGAFTSSTFGQFYIRAGGGYSISLAEDVLFYTYGTASLTTNYGSFGAGLDVSGACGYMLSNNFGFEISAQYKGGKEYSGTSILYTYTELESKISGTGRYWGVNPSIILSAKFADVTAYSRIGMLLAWPSVEYNETATNEKLTDKYSGNNATGLTGAFGVEFESWPVVIYIELDFVSLSWRPAQVEKFHHESTRKIKLVDSIDSIDYPDLAVLTSSMPFSRIGLGAGIKLYL